MQVPLPFLLRRENIVRYEGGEVLILDRRHYPFRTEFVRCRDFQEVATAIEEMVTQSSGPRYCAGYAMVQTARTASGLRTQNALRLVREAAMRLVAARPTNAGVRLIVRRMEDEVRTALDIGKNAEESLLSVMESEWTARDERGRATAHAAASIIEDGTRILTHCWPETGGLAYALILAVEQGKRIQAYCTETRPYLQGARLTADVIAEIGIPTTVVTDGMPAHLMSARMVDCFFAGADRVTMDGHLINKIGTLQIAVAAHYFGVPFYSFTPAPDPTAPSVDAVPMEDRDPVDTLQCRGVRTATPRAVGYYPAFDVTPPTLIRGFVTPHGVFLPQSLRDQFGLAPMPTKKDGMS